MALVPQCLGTAWGGVPWASSGSRPEMLLSVPQRTDGPPKTHPRSMIGPKRSTSPRRTWLGEKRRCLPSAIGAAPQRPAPQTLRTERLIRFPSSPFLSGPFARTGTASVPLASGGPQGADRCSQRPQPRVTHPGCRQPAGLLRIAVALGMVLYGQELKSQRPPGPDLEKNEWQGQGEAVVRRPLRNGAVAGPL